MLKKKTIDLLGEIKDLKSVFSICIGKSHLYQIRFKDYLGEYKRWDTDCKEGILKLDDRVFSVEYIGSTSNSDNYWYSAEIEKVIPNDYVELIMNTRKMMESLSIPVLSDKKILLNEDKEEDMAFKISAIYLAFAPQNVTLFCGRGYTNVYMFVKNLPDDIFQTIEPREFVTRIPEIISRFDVDHRLMIQALLTENDIEYQIDEKSIVAKFSEDAIITISFNENGLITGISGKL